MSTLLVSQTATLSFQLSYSSLLHCPEKRKAEAERIRQKYPDRIPVSSNLMSITRNTQLCGVNTGHLRESRQNRHPHHRQEEVLGTFCEIS